MKKKNNRWYALLILLTAPLLSVIDVFITNMAVPSIKQGIHATDAAMQLVIAGYILGYAVFLIIGGRAGDLVGRKKVFLYGMAFFTLTSALCGLALTPLQLNVMRILQGISAAFMTPQTIAYIQVLFPEPDARTKALGVFGFVITSAAMIGQLLGGILPEYHGIIEGWRLIFIINLPIGIVSFILAYRNLVETPANKDQKLDFAGVALLTAALFALIYPLIQGRELGWPLWILALLASSFFMLWYFISHQKNKLARGGSPLINLNLFSYRDFNLGILAMCLYFIVHTSYLLIFTVYLQEGLRMPPNKAGLTFALFGLGGIVSSVSSVKLYIRYGKIVLQFGALLMASALGFQFFVFDPHAEPYIMMATLFIQGLGTGIIIPSLLNVTLRNVPVEYAGTASGVYNTIQQTSSALGVSLIAGIFFLLIDPSDQGSFYVAFQYCLMIQVACLAVVGLLLYMLPEKMKTAEAMEATR